VVQLRHLGRSMDEIATELKDLGVRDASHAQTLLSSARDSLHAELALVSSAGRVNPFTTGTPDAWVWDYILFEQPLMTPQRFWEIAEANLSTTQLQVLRLRSRGISYEAIRSQLGFESDAPIRSNLSSAKKKLRGAMSPPRPRSSRWAEEIVGSVSGATMEEFWDVVGQMPERHRVAARIRAEGRSDADIAVATGTEIDGSFMYSLRGQLQRRLSLLHAPPGPTPEQEGARWVATFLNGYPGRTPADFRAAVAQLNSQDQRRAIEYRAAGRSTRRNRGTHGQYQPSGELVTRQRRPPPGRLTYGDGYGGTVK